MTTEALVLMLVIVAVIWGGLAAAIIALVRRPESGAMPDGGEDTEVPD